MMLAARENGQFLNGQFHYEDRTASIDKRKWKTVKRKRVRFALSQAD